MLEAMVGAVVVLVAVAALVPGVSAIRRNSQRGRCASNMAQLSRALIIYSESNDQRLPQWWFDDSRTTWDSAIFPLVNNKKTFECDTNVSRLVVPKGSTIRSFAFPRNVSGMRTGDIPQPKKTVILFEKGALLLFDWNDSTGEFFQQMFAIDVNPDYYPHGDGKNFAFADGHVGYAKINKGPFAYAFLNSDTGRNWPRGYCGNRADGIHDLSINTDPGANLPR